jgi:acetyl/propionyl-CoA carboxylase alpha subunit
MRPSAESIEARRQDSRARSYASWGAVVPGVTARWMTRQQHLLQPMRSATVMLKAAAGGGGKGIRTSRPQAMAAPFASREMR